MGLYDTIHVKVKLPSPTEPKGFTGVKYFQTKDLECGLAEYEIREDGTFWRQEIEYTEAECKDKLFGVEVKSKGWVFDTTTKTIQMYDLAQQEDSEYDYWIEYKVVIIKGVIDTIDIVKFEAKSNTERKENDRLFFDNLTKREELFKTKRYRYIYAPYTSLVYNMVNAMASTIYFTTQSLNKLMVGIYKLRNKITI